MHAVDDPRIVFASVLLEAVADATEDGKPIVIVARRGDTSPVRLAHRIGVIRRPLRAPHHTVNDRGLVGEVAMAAGGTLLLDQAHLFKLNPLASAMATWKLMGGNPAQPLIVACVELPPLPVEGDDVKALAPLREVFGKNMIVIRL